MGSMMNPELPVFFYCSQCTDKASGQVGSFVHNGDLVAISPVFSSLAEFLPWMKEQGYVHAEYDREGNYTPWRIQKKSQNAEKKE